MRVKVIDLNDHHLSYLNVNSNIIFDLHIEVEQKGMTYSKLYLLETTREWNTDAKKAKYLLSSPSASKFSWHAFESLESWKSSSGITIRSKILANISYSKLNT